jgi:hypothetical protein
MIMNWYKLAQTWETSGSLEDDVEESQNKEELTRALQVNGIDVDIIEEIVFPNKEVIWTVIIGNSLSVIEISFPYPSIKKADDWMWDIINSSNIWQYVGEIDFSKEFWDEVGEGTNYYHGTTRENLDSILKEGLSPRNEARGISNRGVGVSVFLSEDYETAAYGGGYDVVLEVNIGAMKQAGYMPQVSLEPDIEEHKYVGSLADKIGLNDFIYDVEGGMGFDTIILDGGVPPQYIRVI